MLNTAVNEVGSYLHSTRCNRGDRGNSGGPRNDRGILCVGRQSGCRRAVVLLLALMEKVEPDELGGLSSGSRRDGSILQELGLDTALGVIITDKETQTPAGMLIVGTRAARINGGPMKRISCKPSATRC